MSAETLHQISNVIFGLDPKIVSSTILIVVYIILFSEKLNRAVVAFLGTCAMIFTGVLTQAQALKGIDCCCTDKDTLINGILYAVATKHKREGRNNAKK